MISRRFVILPGGSQQRHRVVVLRWCCNNNNAFGSRTRTSIRRSSTTVSSTLSSSSSSKLFGLNNSRRKEQQNQQSPIIVTTTNKNYFSTINNNNSNNSTSSSGERIRIAIVGGGVAGLSAALHLAPLVNKGYINGPIDVYENNNPSGRKIGVGIWSTALDPFGKNTHIDSHQLVYKDLTVDRTFLKDVGYRTPKGHWLAESRLDGGGTTTATTDPTNQKLPDLLFLSERDMLASLRKGVHLEEQHGTIALHTGSDMQVDSIYESSTEPWSSTLLLRRGTSTGTDDSSSSSGTTATTDSTSSSNHLVKSERDYHLIVAADGMNSTLRKTYGGHICRRGTMAANSAWASPLELPDDIENSRRGRNSDNSSTNTSGIAAAGGDGADRVPSWQVTGQAEATGIQDREYTVFRGNAHMTTEELGLDKSFQTWGEGKNMRFATVPMIESVNGRREERQVWFITINDETITSEEDSSKRRDLLLHAFQDWHDPISRLVKATPPDEILMERAMAHKHCMSPVANFNGVVSQIRKRRPPSMGNGPAIVFLGDAFMTVDPILAQGFTIGMEGAAALATSIEATINLSSSSLSYHPTTNLSFDPYILRDELKSRHDLRLNRLICLLRATELVQALGQPPSGTIMGWISRDIIRPVMRILPNFIKTPIFNSMLKYSLGLPMSSSTSSSSSTSTITSTTTSQ